MSYSDTTHKTYLVVRGYLGKFHFTHLKIFSQLSDFILL